MAALPMMVLLGTACVACFGKRVSGVLSRRLIAGHPASEANP